MNIIKDITRQIENGKIFIGKRGEVVSEQERDDAIVKGYKDGVKSGDIDFTTLTFERYKKDREEEYITCQSILALFPAVKEKTDNDAKKESIKEGKDAKKESIKEDKESIKDGKEVEKK